MKKSLLYLSLLSFICLSFTSLKGESGNKQISLFGEPYKLKKTFTKNVDLNLIETKTVLESQSMLIDSTERGALSLAGGHQVSIPSADINPILSGDFTIEFWVKLKQDPGTNDKLISNHGRFSNNNTTGLSLEMPADNSIQLVFGTNTGSWNSLNSGAPVNIGEWTHVAVTASPNNTAKIYINGDFKTQVNYGTFVTNTNWDFALGKSINYGGETISEMDELRIWSSERTADDIHENMYVSLDGSASNLEYNFTFNQGDIGTIINSGTKADVSYTSASIEGSNAPVRNLVAPFQNHVAANWSAKNDASIGFSIQDMISDYDSNVVIAKEDVNNQVLPFLGNTSADTLYLNTKWLVDPHTIDSITPQVNLTHIFSNLNNSQILSDEYYLIEGDPTTSANFLASGTKTNNLISFPKIEIDSTNLYLAWKKLDTYPMGSFPIASENIWKYNDNGVSLDSQNWKDINYDDSAWEFGNGLFGYGDGIETTPLDYGPDSNNKYPTYYFRYTFDVTNASQYGDLLFNVVKDDGVVIYLNGTEVSRLNMPSGPITYNTYASSAIGGSAESTWHQIQTSNLLQNGTNVIAVELHQGSAGSSDLRFDMSVDYLEPSLDNASYPFPKDSEWYYLDTGVSLDNDNWQDASYDVTGWSIGYAPLGYGDPVNTKISYGPNGSNKYITSYFVRDIDVDITSVANTVKFGIKRDDGSIVYVNGIEVIRDNMPSGSIDYQTTSSSIVDGADEGRYHMYELPKTVFQDGENRIAVEVHNRDGQSSDLKFDMFIEDVVDFNFNCNNPHIGCFTSIAPTAQTNQLIIPEDHRFQLIFKQGDAYMDGSGNVPGNNDFTAYVPLNGSSEQGYLSVNHENTPGGVSIVDLHLNNNTTLWVLDNSQPVDLYNTAMETTTRNCSGGITPWGTVVTAEESTNNGDNNNDGYEDVGWLVEIDPTTAEVMDYGNGQEKLWAMGRMNHENVVISQDATTAYYGEDGGTHCLYKYVMDTPGDLTAGTVYVLKLNLGLTNDEPNSSIAEWIEVPNDTQLERNNLNTTAGALGGTNFNGVEDCEIGLDGKIYFTAKGRGRVYRFKDNGNDVSEFETFLGGMNYDIQTTNGVVSEAWGYGNDNLTFDDKGNLWVLQDGGNNYIWVVRPDHTQTNPKVELFASMPAGSEPTGLTFTPDYKYGFFSIQHPNGNNASQKDATFNNITINASSTVVFSLNENLGIQTPVTDFTADKVQVAKGQTVTFSDLSSNNPDAWNWTFEGGNPSTSTAMNPTVTYDTEGTFNVTLETSNVAGSNEVVKDDYIEVQTLSIDENLKDKISIYPNPTQGNLNISVKEGHEVSVEVFDMLGRRIKYLPSAEVTNQPLSLDLSSVAKGSQILVVKVTVDGNSGSYKVLTTE